jgi:hypothetical protein
VAYRRDVQSPVLRVFLQLIRQVVDRNKAHGEQ